METFSVSLAICEGNSPVPKEFPHKGQWRGALMFSLICVWINDWVNIREAGDLRRYCTHYDVIVMSVYNDKMANNGCCLHHYTDYDSYSSDSTCNHILFLPPLRPFTINQFPLPWYWSQRSDIILLLLPGDSSQPTGQCWGPWLHWQYKAIYIISHKIYT